MNKRWVEKRQKNLERWRAVLDAIPPPPEPTERDVGALLCAYNVAIAVTQRTWLPAEVRELAHVTCAAIIRLTGQLQALHTAEVRRALDSRHPSRRRRPQIRSGGIRPAHPMKRKVKPA
jgi:hypothetical protein